MLTRSSLSTRGLDLSQSSTDKTALRKLYSNDLKDSRIIFNILIHILQKDFLKMIAASGFDPPTFECLEEIFLEYMSPTRFPYATLQLFLD